MLSKWLKIISVFILGGLVAGYVYASIYTSRLLSPSEFLSLSHALLKPVQRQQVNTKPVEIHLSSPLPSGKAYAYFDIYTGSDQMTYKQIKTRPLILVVQYDNKELRQTIASCEDVSHGTAAGGGTETELEVADCDSDRYWLITENGKVLVQKGEWDKRE